jgi:regulator of replication initiation timing
MHPDQSRPINKKNDPAREKIYSCHKKNGVARLHNAPFHVKNDLFPERNDSSREINDF